MVEKDILFEIPVIHAPSQIVRNITNGAVNIRPFSLFLLLDIDYFPYDIQEKCYHFLNRYSRKISKKRIEA
jgi:hypothetical protein